MEEFEVLQTIPFAALFEKLDKREREWVQKMKQQLSFNPFAGKPLYQDWFREKKFEDRRLYFLVHGQKKRVMLVAFGSKKDQQKTIEYILAHRTEFWEELEKT